ncbi:alpha/beta hydrolase [Actinomadura algeriensis]|uniref:Acetyl esterase/lipase n=1 Tax=Actinomadura algeriensis TaxID=1679523 RepID=A0ABR9JZT6_9ACTN|nr:alpha/beta hydrolase [Actinomadura algeriensis]MBE1536096.1 acetyl esterase/lipase [Actinomadura algeriensis]
MAADGLARSTVAYAERDTGPLLMDLVVPAGAAVPPPVVIWLHGGGWFTGDRTMAPDLAVHFASRGFAMASIDYRLSGAALFPAQLHDVQEAIRYVRGRARGLGVDPNAIGLWGSSAGGHLAALAGLSGEPGGDAAVQAVAEGYGPVDLARIVAESAAPPHMAGENAPEARLLGGRPDALPDAARAASPLTYVTPAAPPFLIAHGTADALVRPDQSVLLHDALAGAGVDGTLYLLDGVGHGFLNPRGPGEVGGMGAAMDDGRLDAAPLPRAARRDAHGAEERTVFSYATIGDFFDRVLRG